MPESLYQLSCSLLEVFGTGAFLRILRNFKNIFFYRIFPWLILRRNIILPKPQQSLAALLKPSRHKQTISRSLDMCFFIDVSSSPLSISARPMEPLPAEWNVKCKNSKSSSLILLHPKINRYKICQFKTKMKVSTKTLSMLKSTG